MKGLQDISFENEAKIRKALVSISIVTLVLSNVELSSNELNFFGLKIIVSIENMAAVLRLAIVLLLVALSLILAERAPRLIVRVLKFRDEKWWLTMLPDLEAFHNANRQWTDEDEYHEFSRNNPDLDDLIYSEKYERSQRRLKVLAYFRPIAIVSRTMTKYVFPITLAFLALFFPQAVFVLA